MTSLSLPAEAITVEEAIKINKCTARTLEQLQHLLGTRHDSLTKYAPSSKRPKTPIEQDAGPQGRAPRGKSIKTPMTRRDGFSDPLSPLKPPLRTRFATQVINVSLKALTAIVRGSNLPNNQNQSVSDTQQTQQTQHTAQASCDLNPLRALSPNHQSTSYGHRDSRKKREKEPLQSTTEPSSGNIATLADCACAALAVLREEEHVSRDASERQSYQVELAASSLINKFVVLDLESHAISELCVLIPHLSDKHEQILPNPKKANRQRHNTIPQQEQNIVGMILCNQLPVSEKALDLWINAQIQILKLGAKKMIPSDAEKIITHFESGKASVVLAIEKRLSGSSDPELKQRSAKWLEQLAQVLESLGSIDVSTDEIPSFSYTSFRCMSLAIRLKLRSCNLITGRSGLLKKILESFQALLSCFVQRKEALGNKKYLVIKREAETFLRKSKALVPEQLGSETFDLFALKTYRALADVAAESQNFPTAAAWLKKALEIPITTSCSACAVVFQLATIQIQQALSDAPDSKFHSTLKRAAEDLKKDLKGTSTEMDELFVSIATLRKYTMRLILKTEPSESGDGIQVDAADRSICKDILQYCSKFLIRFAASLEINDQTISTDPRLERRYELIKKSILPTIEALAALSRSSMGQDRGTWAGIAESLHALQELLLSHGFNSDSEFGVSYQQSRRHPLLIISNTFWCRYLELKPNHSTNAEQIQLLGASIQALSSCTIDEQETGFLHLKYEKLSWALECSKNSQGALDKITKALGTLVSYPSSLKILQTPSISERFSSAMLKDRLKRLRQLLLSYLRLQSLDSDVKTRDFVAFQSPSAGIDVQANLMEMQLAIAIELISSDHQSIGSKVIEEIYAFLKKVYSPGHGCRLVDVHLTLLHSRCIKPKIYSTGFSELLDADFAALSAHLASNEEILILYEQHRVYLLILRNELRNGELRDILYSWRRLICSSVQNSYELENRTIQSRWRPQLMLLQDLFLSQGLESLLVIVTDILMKLGHPETDPSEFVRQSAIICQQLTRLGHCEAACEYLLRCKEVVSNRQKAEQSSLLWYFAYSECLLEIDDASRCFDMLQRAERQLQDLYMAEKNPTLSLSERYTRLCLISQLMNLRSRLSIAKNNRGEAIFYAKKSTRLAHRAWSLLESRRDIKTDSKYAQEDLIAVSSSNANGAENRPVASAEHDSLRDVQFWGLGPLLFRHTIHLAYLLADEGVFLEAQYYMDKSQNFAKAMQSAPFKAEVVMLRTYMQRLAGTTFSDLEDLNRFLVDSWQLSPPLRADINLALAEAYHASSDFENEVNCLKDAELAIGKSLEIPLELGLQAPLPLDGLAKSLDGLSLTDKAIKAPTRKGTRTARKDGKVGGKLKSSVSPIEEGIYDYAHMPLKRRQIRRLQQSALLALRLKDLDLMTSLLQEAGGFSSHSNDALKKGLCQSYAALAKSAFQLEKDPVFSLLRESTVMYPSVIHDTESANDVAKNDANASIGRGRYKKPESRSKNISKECKQQLQEVQLLLDGSNQVLLRALGNLQAHTTTAITHSLSDVLCKSQLLLSVMKPSAPVMTLSPSVAVYVLEYGRSMAFMRDEASTLADCELNEARDSSKDVSLSTSAVHFEVPRLDVSTFQTDYINNIPANWTAISISVSEDHGELRISRMRQAQPPLILSIPLNRHNPRECDDDESFGFDEGKSELLEIISLANFSAHEGCDLSKKGAKTAWWESRAALDARLRDLVVNIQNMWIGGFRGVFSQHIANTSLLPRFQRSMDNILNQHLPSRQRQKKTEFKRVTLDVQVLELFIGLGNPSKNDDLDEALLDLFYFVVDILQFHGERNAYDEIDFDCMIVATLDALKQYHNAIAETQDQDQRAHTILILDKALHAFPWESLPCMNGLAISRLPSLSCLQDRIKRHQHPPATDLSSSAIVADSTSGAYVLDPSGDLSSTHKAFSSPLSALTTWDAMVKSNPSENDIATALANRSIYLYFGHGSGAQYIRSRTIRKLDKCGVALLMGCSSGSLTEAGQFESYGPLMAYLHAGSPAVVGTLWDVTDKDIDRFALTALQRWGLIKDTQDKDGRVQDRNRKEAQKSSLVTNAADRSTLDEAVAGARGSCILRYLNGAAPVVYGVPVMLK